MSLRHEIGAYARPKRGLIVLTFATLGIGVGILVFMIGLTAQLAVTEGPMGLLAPLMFFVLFPLVVAFALIGVPPAIACGLIYAFLPRVVQRIALAPFIGLALCYPLAPAFRLGYSDDISGMVLFCVAGMSAAGVCAYAVRLWGLDGRGAEAQAL